VVLVRKEMRSGLWALSDVRQLTGPDGRFGSLCLVRVIFKTSRKLVVTV